MSENDHREPDGEDPFLGMVESKRLERSSPETHSESNVASVRLICYAFELFL
jgi:hypothetical protein